MNIEQARAIIKAESESDERLVDHIATVEAIATWARFHGIADKRLIAVAESLEKVADELKADGAPTP